MKKHIIFVCNANIHRSVIAAEAFKKILKEQGISSKYSVASYGLQGTMGTKLPKHRRLSQYPKEWNAAKPTLENLGVDISRHSFRKISKARMKRADVVIAMDDEVYAKLENSLLKQFPHYSKKIYRFGELQANGKGIKDPFENGSKRLHKKLIENMYFTLTKKYKKILSWAE